MSESELQEYITVGVTVFIIFALLLILYMVLKYGFDEIKRRKSMSSNKEDSSDKNIEDNTETEKDATRIKYKIGREVLFFAMVAMLVFVFTDLIAISISRDSGLVEKAFDAFKIITMTVLGYMFGSSNVKNSEK